MFHGEGKHNKLGTLPSEFIITENWLYDTQKDRLGAMLDEDPALMERRNQIAKRLELYKQARDDIDSVAWK